MKNFWSDAMIWGTNSWFLNVKDMMDNRKRDGGIFKNIDYLKSCCHMFKRRDDIFLSATYKKIPNYI